MPDALTTNPEPSTADTAASNACTRSGAFALLLSTALVLLIPYWIQRPNEIELGRYIMARSNLSFQIDALDTNQIWQIYKNSHENAELTPISQLIDVDVPVTFTSVGKVTTPPNRQKMQNAPASPRQNPSVPNPIFLSAVAQTTAPMKLSNMSTVRDSLILLDDAEMLSRSRRVGNFFNISIVRWVQKRSDLTYRRIIANSCAAELEVPNKTKRSDYFIPTLAKDALLNCLTISDIRELAHFELPAFSDPAQLQGRVQSEVQVSPGTLPKDLLSASIVAQMLLFFVIVHFAAYAREAVLSAHFPARGTLFGAFAQSRWTLLVLLLAIWTPLAASIAVTLTSRNWILAACSVLIFGAVVLVYLTLQHHSYFRFRRQEPESPVATTPSSPVPYDA